MGTYRSPGEKYLWLARFYVNERLQVLFFVSLLDHKEAEVIFGMAVKLKAKRQRKKCCFD